MNKTNTGASFEMTMAGGARRSGVILPVLLVGLFLRAVMFVAFHRSPLTGVYVLDTLYYRTWALRIASGSQFNAGVFEQSPLYAYLLGAIFRLCGPSELPVIAFQMLCGLVTVVVLFDTSRRIFGERVALATGLLAAAYGPFLLHESLLMKSYLEPLFVSFAFWAVVRFGGEHRVRWAVASGVAIGLAVLVREVHVILLVPTALALVRPAGAAAVRHRLAGVAALLLAFSVTILPAAVRNYALSGDLTFVTAAGGENIYLAYGPEAGEFYAILPFVTAVSHREHEDFREEATLRAGRTLSRGQASGFWYRETLRALRADPGRAVRLALRKLKVLFQDYEVPDSEDFSVARKYLPFLWALPTFGWIFGLGLIGLIAPVRTLRNRRPLIWLLMFLAVEVVVTFNLARYRLALVAIWLIPAGAGAVWLLVEVRARGRGALRPAVTGLFVAAATAFSFLPPPKSFPRAQLTANQRALVDKTARRAAALPAAIAAAAAEPWNPERQMELGALLRNLGRIPEGLAAYETILRDNPAHFAARWELASTLVEEGRLAEAIEHLRLLTRQAPSNVAAHYFLGRFLSRNAAGFEPATARGYEDEAWGQIQAALRLDPAHAPSLYEAGRRLYLRGDTPGAVAALNRALQVAPGLDEAARLLQIIRSRQG